MNADFETHMSAGKLASMAAKLLWGVASGAFSPASLKRLLGALSISGRIRAAYERYPETFEGFEDWLTQVRPLWGE